MSAIRSIFPYVFDLSVSATTYGESSTYNIFDYVIDVPFNANSNSYISIPNLVIGDSKLKLDGVNFASNNVLKNPTNTVKTDSFENCIKEIMSLELNASTSVFTVDTTAVSTFQSELTGTGKVLNEYSSSDKNIKDALKSITEQFISRAISNSKISFVSGDSIYLLVNLTIARNMDSATGLSQSDYGKFAATFTQSAGGNPIVKKLGVKLYAA